MLPISQRAHPLVKRLAPRAFSSSPTCNVRRGPRSKEEKERRTARAAGNSPKPLTPAQLAQIKSTPHKVRERRAMQGISEDYAIGELTAPQLSDYRKLIRRGAFLSPNRQQEPTAENWLKDQKHRWERVRGVDLVPSIDPHNPDQHAQRVSKDTQKREEVEERARKKSQSPDKDPVLGKGNDDTEESEWDRRRELAPSTPLALPKSDNQNVISLDLIGVGRKVYLPNIIFRLMPNHTLKGEPYNPYEATFRIPQSVTKTDVRSYLRAMYGLKVTYIRTDNYFSPIVRRPFQPKGRHNSKRTYKRAVVGLASPFVFPEMMEDMTLAERESRQKYLNETFYLDLMQRDKREAEVRSLGLRAGWNSRVTGKKNIVRSARGLLEEREDRLLDAMEALERGLEDVKPE